MRVEKGCCTDAAKWRLQQRVPNFLLRPSRSIYERCCSATKNDQKSYEVNPLEPQFRLTSGWIAIDNYRYDSLTYTRDFRHITRANWNGGAHIDSKNRHTVTCHGRWWMKRSTHVFWDNHSRHAVSNEKKCWTLSTSIHIFDLPCLLDLLTPRTHVFS